MENKEPRFYDYDDLFLFVMGRIFVFLFFIVKWIILIVFAFSIVTAAVVAGNYLFSLL